MEKLKQLRIDNGLTQKAMAEKIGITLSMYEKVESGRVDCSAAFMRRVKAKFPNISIDDIFFADNSKDVAHILSKTI